MILEAVECGQDALDAINRDEPDAILLDLRLPDMDGLEILRWIRERDLQSEVVIITAHRARSARRSRPCVTERTTFWSSRSAATA